MILNKIRLNNIRSYEQEEIVFPRGSTVLAGDIGSGKTSILLAIEFALFGLQPGQKGSGLLRNGKDEGSVSLEVEVDDQKIIIERGLKKSKSVNQSYSALEIGGVRQEMSVTELKNKVLELLSYPQEFSKKTNILYRFTVYTPQEEMKQIILETPESRLNTLRYIFGIDKYKRIRENAELFASRLREGIRNFEGQIKDLEDMKKKLEEKKQNLLILESNIEVLKQELILKKNERKNIETSVKDVSEKIKEKEKYEREVDKTRIMLLSKQDVLSNIEKDKRELQKQIEDIRIQLEKSDLKKLLENISKLKEEVRKIRESQPSKENELKEYELKIREKQKSEQETETLNIKFRSIKEKISDIEEEKSRLASQIEEFAKMKFKPEDIETIKASLKQNEDSYEQKNKLYSDLNSKIETLNSKIDELKKSKIDLPKLVNCPTCFQNVPQDYKNNVLRKFDDDILHSKKKIESLYLEKESVMKMIDSIRYDISSLRRSLDDKERLKIKYEDIKEKEKKLMELKNQNIVNEQETLSLNKRIEILQQSISLLKKFDSIYEQKKKELQDLNQIELEKERAITNNQREYDKSISQEESKKEKESRISELEIKKTTVEKDSSLLEKQIETLKESISLLKKFDLIYEQKGKELEEALRKEKEKEIELASSLKEKEMTLRLIDDIDRDILKKEDTKKKLIEIGELEDWLSSSFLEIISFTERNIMLRLREEFSKLFNEWFNILVPEIFNVRLDEDFTPIIEQKDYSLDYSFLSGGERTAIALAYRLALNQVINSLLSKIKTRDLIILDEPTDGFSEQQLDKMRDVFSQLKVAQLLIVSHEAKIESFVENIIRFKKEDGVTKVAG